MISGTFLNNDKVVLSPNHKRVHTRVTSDEAEVPHFAKPSVRVNLSSSQWPSGEDIRLIPRIFSPPARIDLTEKFVSLHVLAEGRWFLRKYIE
jgi:hypothetical protein